MNKNTGLSDKSQKTSLMTSTATDASKRSSSRGDKHINMVNNQAHSNHNHYHHIQYANNPNDVKMVVLDVGGFLTKFTNCIPKPKQSTAVRTEEQDQSLSQQLASTQTPPPGPDDKPMSPSLDSYKVQSEKAFFNENYYTIQSKAASKFIIREKTAQLNTTNNGSTTVGSIPSMQLPTTATTTTTTSGQNQVTTTTVLNNDVDSGLYSYFVINNVNKDDHATPTVNQHINKSRSSTNSTNTFKAAGSEANRGQGVSQHKNQVVNIELDQGDTTDSSNMVFKSLSKNGLDFSCDKFFDEYFNIEALMNLKSMQVLDSPCLLHSAKLSLLNQANEQINKNNMIQNLNKLVFNANNGNNYSSYSPSKNVFKQPQQASCQQPNFQGAQAKSSHHSKNGRLQFDRIIKV